MEHFLLCFNTYLQTLEPIQSSCYDVWRVFDRFLAFIFTNIQYLTDKQAIFIIQTERNTHE